MESTNGYTFYISECDYVEVSKYNWRLDADGYAIRNGDGRKLHRHLLNVTDPSIFVDHKDRNPRNNTRENLRISTRGENKINSNKQRVKCYGDNWRFDIAKDGVKYYSPRYSTKEEAMIMYNRKAIEMHGEFAVLFDIHDDGRIIESVMEKKKTSKYKYVSYHKRDKRWVVSVKGKQYGQFKTEQEAYEFSKVVKALWLSCR